MKRLVFVLTAFLSIGCSQSIDVDKKVTATFPEKNTGQTTETSKTDDTANSESRKNSEEGIKSCQFKFNRYSSRSALEQMNCQSRLSRAS
ncbi:hypothetical protein HR060_03725 [Catenovulum sp. SM1970]|uniref:hypothetical protein n=1 Tax=Marinifaba aquimaris TaxID=2741323 RepID=UPI001572FFF4|nr:hypothetical protein [Marinifaba aquimaris]NTS75967.1 hypothetical protein [Marinifaba aquimaris]